MLVPILPLRKAVVCFQGSCVSQDDSVLRSHSRPWRSPIHALVLSKPGNGCPSLLGFRFAFLLVTLVVQFAALAKAEGHLEPGTLEVEIQGDEGEALLLEGGAELIDLAAVGQQFAHPQRFVVEEAASMAVG